MMTPVAATSTTTPNNRKIIADQKRAISLSLEFLGFPFR